MRISDWSSDVCSSDLLHVPGHTPEHLALVVTDRTRGPEPWFVLTGHTLMVGDMGRTELASAAEAGARTLFRSAEQLRADRKSVVEGKRVAVRVDLGGRRLLKKKKPNKEQPQHN